MERKEEKHHRTKETEEELVKQTEGDELVKDFKAEYKKRGNADLLYQVDYLSKVADRYQEKDDWASLLRAHALYNSCAVRDAERREEWLEKAYQVQVKYWGTDLQSFPQHLQVTEALKRELEDIRTRGRELTDNIAQLFRGLECEPEKLTCAENQQLYNRIMQDIPNLSNSVNSDMIKFTRSVVDRAQNICGPSPNKYTVVAMGSMARREMTPYSDLEFLFLTESNTEQDIQHFQKLSVTIYFLVGNLCETKLKVMAIPELLGWDNGKEKLFHWFDDTCMSGFKIDGLGSWAGNIPTGGTPEQKNKFICTVEELAERYKTILNAPDPDKSLKGDFTAMLANTAFVAGDPSLLEEFKSLVTSYQPNEQRKGCNVKMLANDAKQFNFKPSFDLTHMRQLKPDIYRYPSILILNLKVIHGIQSCDPWEIIGLLKVGMHISPLTAECLRFSFCCALFIRQSAYFYHNSQNDSISVLSCNTDDNLYKGAWYVEPELLVHMFANLVPLKAAVSRVANDPSQRIVVERAIRPMHETVATVRYYCEEYSKVLSLLKAVYRNSIESAGSFTQHLFIHSAIRCNKYEVRELLEKRVESQSCDHYDFHLLGILYENQSLFSEALDAFYKRLEVLQSSHCSMKQEHIAQTYSNIGIVLRAMGQYTEALIEYEKSLELYKALFGEKDHVQTAKAICNIGVVLTNQAKYPEALQEHLKCLKMRLRIYGARDHVEIAGAFSNIGVVLFRQQKYEDALTEYSKCLDMTLRIYGDKDHVEIADVFCNIGNVLRNMSRYAEALVEYKKCLDMRLRIYGDRDQLDVADILSNISAVLQKQNRCKEALVGFNRCLAMYSRIFEGKDRVQTADILCNIGSLLHGQRRYNEALVVYKRCLDMYGRIYGDSDHANIAIVLCSVGSVLDDQGRCDEALDMYRTCLDMRLRLYPDEDHIEIAGVLCNIGLAKQNQNKPTEALLEYTKSLAMYKRLYKNGDHPLIADVLCNVGNTLLNQGKYTEALEEHKNCLGMRLRINQGKDCVQIADALCNLGVVLCRQGKHTESIEKYTKSLDIYMGIHGGKDNLHAANVLLNIGNILLEQKKYENALVEYRKCQDMYGRIYGGRHNLDEASVLSNIGVVLDCQGKHTEALTEYHKCMEVYQHLYGGRDHIQIAKILCNKGEALKNQCKYSEALIELSKGLEMFVRIIGDGDHPYITQVKEDIQQVKGLMLM